MRLTVKHMRAGHVIVLDSAPIWILQRVSKLQKLCSSPQSPECDRYEKDTRQELGFQMKNHVRTDNNTKTNVDIQFRILTCKLSTVLTTVYSSKVSSTKHGKYSCEIEDLLENKGLTIYSVIS
jgi:hypothetical protein